MRIFLFAVASLLPRVVLAQTNPCAAPPAALACPNAAGVCVVTSNAADLSDENPGDGSCGVSISGVCRCTLRAAIRELDQWQIQHPADTTSHTIDLSGFASYPIAIGPSNSPLDPDTGDLDIWTNVTLSGGAKTPTVGWSKPTDRILHIVAHPPVPSKTNAGYTTYPVPTVTVDHVRLDKGSGQAKTDANATKFDGGSGGAVWVDTTPNVFNGSFSTVCATLSPTFLVPTFVLTNSAITGSRAALGAGIFSTGVTSITKSEIGASQGVIDGNIAASLGGGIVSFTASKNCDCTQSNVCTSEVAPASILKVQLSTVANNSGPVGGGIVVFNLAGGARTAPALTVTDSHIDSNGGVGGGIATIEDNPTDNAMVSTITDSTISKNFAPTGGAGAGVLSTLSVIGLYGVTVSGNQLSGTPAADSNFKYFGGAGLLLESSTVTIDRSAKGPSIISDNRDDLDYTAVQADANGHKAVFSGGGIVFDPDTNNLKPVPTLTVRHTIISHNFSSYNGGGVYLSRAGTSTINDKITPQALTALFDEVSFDGNVAVRDGQSKTGGWGSAIYLENQEPYSGTNPDGNIAGTGFGAVLQIQNSTLSNNGCLVPNPNQSSATVLPPLALGCDAAGTTTVAENGGGIGQLGGSVYAVNTTFSNNRVTVKGGAWASGFASLGQIDNCTIVGNTATDAGGLSLAFQTTDTSDGGQLFNPTALLKNTILTDNIATTMASADCDGSGFSAGTGLTSAGYNLIQNDGCSALDSASAVINQLATTDVTHVSAQVGALADNGGTAPFVPQSPSNTLTQVPGAPAIDKIPLASCTWTDFTGTAQALTADERGVVRPTGSGCDIGAVEIGAVTTGSSSGGGSTADLSVLKEGPESATLGETILYKLTVSNAGPSVATSVSVTDALPTGTTFVSASGANGTCTSVAGTVTCTVDSLAPGAAAVFTLSVHLDAAGVIINTATVTSHTPDQDGSNNTSQSVHTNVSSVSPLSSFLFAGGGVHGCHANGDSGWLLVGCALLFLKLRNASRFRRR